MSQNLIQISVTSSVAAMPLQVYDNVAATLDVTLTPSEDITLTSQSQIIIAFSSQSTSTIAISKFPKGWQPDPSTLLTMIYTGATVWKASEEICFSLSNVLFTIAQAPVALDVILNFINGSPFPIIPNPSITIGVTDRPVPGGVDISDYLDVNLAINADLNFESNTGAVIYTSSPDAIESNNLYLSFTNKRESSSLFSGCKKQGSPLVTIWFVYGTNSGCLAPAYTPTKYPVQTPADVANTIALSISNAQGNSWQLINSLPGPTDSTPSWSVVPNDMGILGDGANSTITFEFKGIKSFNDPGTTLVYIQFTGFWRDDSTKYNPFIYVKELPMTPGPSIASYYAAFENDGLLHLTWTTKNAAENGVSASWTSSVLNANPQISYTFKLDEAPDTFTITAFNQDSISTPPAVIQPLFNEVYNLPTAVLNDILKIFPITEDIIYLVDTCGLLFSYAFASKEFKPLSSLNLPGMSPIGICGAVISEKGNIIWCISDKKTADSGWCIIGGFSYDTSGQFTGLTGNVIVKENPGEIFGLLGTPANTTDKMDFFQICWDDVPEYMGLGWFTGEKSIYLARFNGYILTGGTQQIPTIIRNTYDDNYFIVLNSVGYFILSKTGLPSYSIPVANYSCSRLATSDINYTTFLLDPLANVIIATNFINSVPGFFNEQIIPLNKEIFIDICFSPDSAYLLILTENSILIQNAGDPTQPYYTISIEKNKAFTISPAINMSVVTNKQGYWRIFLNDTGRIMVIDLEGMGTNKTLQP